MSRLKRWVFGRKFCITADIFKNGHWNPTKRYFCYGGLFTKRKVNVFRLLLDRFTVGKEVDGIQETFEIFLDNMECKTLGPMDVSTPEFVWPDWYMVKRPTVEGLAWRQEYESTIPNIGDSPNENSDAFHFAAGEGQVV